jgi:hypothetical protein
MTVMFSNSTASNRLPVGGTGWTSARILTATSRERPASSGSMSSTRQLHTL